MERIGTDGTATVIIEKLGIENFLDVVITEFPIRVPSKTTMDFNFIFLKIYSDIIIIARGKNIESITELKEF